MKLVYITSKKFPSAKTDPFYVRSMAEAFYQLLGKDFLFFIRGNVPDDLKKINTKSIKVPRRARVVSYFFLFPFLVLHHGWNGREMVILSYDPYLLSIALFWRGVARFRYRVVSDWHQLFDDWRDRYVATRSDYLITTSKRLKGLLSSVCGIESKKILVAYGGVDPTSFTAASKTERTTLRKKLGLPSGKFLVGYVGAFRSVGMEKGLRTMIKALPHLDKNIRMVFVGGTEDYIKEYADLAKELSVENRCIFVKYQPFKKVVEYELAIDVLVIPYPDKHHFRDYGFPMKVWEYMSSGRPIIYSDLEIMREVLGGRGVSFRPDDPRSLVGAVSAVHRDIRQVEKIAARNIEDVGAYTWLARARNIIAFIS